MFFYQCQLAWRSIKRNPILCGLMILSLASGITTTVVCYTAHHSLIKNPLAYKNDHIFLLQLNTWPSAQTYKNMPKNNMPDMVSYGDAATLLQSKIPLRQTTTTVWGGVVSADYTDIPPRFSIVRFNTRDYFEIFDEEFLYGAAWNNSADVNFEAVAVISEQTNQYFFHGKNSVGELITLEGTTYKIVGVIKHKPANNNRMQNVIDRYRQPEEHMYLPFGVFQKLSIVPWYNTQCPIHLNQTQPSEIKNIDLRRSDCLWLSYWVEFSTGSQKNTYENFIRTEILENKYRVQHPENSNFTLSNISQLLELKGITSSTYSVLMKFGFAFFLVCTLNSIAILLAKYFSSASESGLRRALGASRQSIFTQYIIESLLIGILGGILSLATTTIFLRYLKNVFAANPEIIQMGDSESELFVADIHIQLLTLSLALTASFFAGLYPAWVICRTPAAQFLKTH